MTYVFARGFLDGTAIGYGYLESRQYPHDIALALAQRQPWPVGTELGAADTLDVYAVEHWEPAQRQYDARGIAR